VIPASELEAKALQPVAPPPIVESRPEVGSQKSEVGNVGVPPLGGGAPTESELRQQRPAKAGPPAPDARQPWEEEADPNAPIEMAFLLETPPAPDEPSEPTGTPPVIKSTPPSPTATQPKGRRQAVPPPKRVAIESDAAGAAEDSLSAGDTDTGEPLSELVAAPKHATPAEPSKRASNHNRPATNNKLIWIICGSVAAMVLVAVGVLGLSGALSGPAVLDRTPAGPSLLILDWPLDERGGAMMTLDEVDRQVSQERGSLEFHVVSGEPHKLHLQKFGAAPIDVTIPPQKEGARYTFKPEWKALASSGHEAAAIAKESVGDSTSGDDKPVLESIPSLKNWPTDLDAAKKEASKAKKDILLVFFGADRRDWCYKLAKDVLVAPDFRKFSDAKFAPVLFEAKGKSFEPGTPGAKLANQFRIASFPTLVLTDADGLAYALQPYMDPESSDYVKKLRDHLSLREERDKLLAATTQGTDDEKLLAAIDFIRWLAKHDLLHFYEPQIRAWRELADRADPQNEQGQNEALFLTDWAPRLEEAARTGAADLRDVAESLETWKKSHKFKNPNAAAVIHMRLAAALFQADDATDASRFLKEALDCGPTDPRLREMLEDRVAESNHPVSSGTGFAVAKHGYFVTNNHVVEGPGTIWVRLPGDAKKEVAAKIVAADEEHDIALIQLVEPDAAPLKPLPILADSVGRGTSVALFGYPLGDVLGEGIKFNQGVINALPDKGRDGMYLLDCTVNPGNSGGPLCDKRGLVVGLVSAKTLSGEGVGSYGMARPTNIVADFLKAHLPGFKPSTGQGAAKLPEWSDVDALVSPSVVMILKREK
jgi:S1-C subfamily serine protease/thioredoxin-related protein